MASALVKGEVLQNVTLNIPVEFIENSFIKNRIINTAELDAIRFEISRVGFTYGGEGLRKKPKFGLLRTTE